jgi:very-short-patch-repair endonuclease
MSNKKYNIDFFKNLAKQKNGECLSNEYIHCNSKLIFKCQYNHIWDAKPSNIINNKSWCPTCSRISNVTIDDMIKLAKKHNGMCLSINYINSGTKLLWQCEKGHQWMAVPESISAGCWCSQCVNKNILLTINEMQKIAKSKNGKCLSINYINSHTKLLWECEFQHKWMANPTNIKSGKWCPYCNESKGEKFISNYLMKNNISFIKEKSFNDCKNIKLLSFDFYLPEQKLLIEYDGIQHYKPTKFNNCDDNAMLNSFYLTQKNDNIKNNYCIEKSIKLIRIPYTMKNIDVFLNNSIYK